MDRRQSFLSLLIDRSVAGFSESEKEEAKLAIYANILDSMVAILEAMTGRFLIPIISVGQ